jgi:hypothetical protein
MVFLRLEASLLQRFNPQSTAQPSYRQNNPAAPPWMQRFV